MSRIQQIIEEYRFKHITTDQYMRAVAEKYMQSVYDVYGKELLNKAADNFSKEDISIREKILNTKL